MTKTELIVQQRRFEWELARDARTRAAICVPSSCSSHARARGELSRDERRGGGSELVVALPAL